MFARLIGTGSYLPERIMHNAELAGMVETSDEWIQSRTGIRQRHIAADDESASDLAEQATRRALEAAAVDVHSLDLIIVATSTPDLIYPSTACLLQKKLDLRNAAAALDVQAVCSGFIYALDIADKFIRTGAAARALVVGVDINSRILDWSDRSTCVLFGDGAGAVILEASEQPGIYASRLHADGAYADLLKVPAGVSRPGAAPFIHMQGNEVFKFAVTVMADMVDEILAAAKLSKADIDWLVPHQANQRIITAIARKLRLPMTKVISTVAEHGNTSGASIPLALDRGIRDNRIRPGQCLLLEAVGGGFTWGAALLKY